MVRYGLIGFADLDVAAGELLNFFMSCRVQRKRVEQAFFQHAASLLAERGVEFEFHSDDLLYPTFSADELEQLLAVAADLRAAGSRLRVERIGRDEILALEPALSDRVLGGLIAEGERRLHESAGHTGGARRRP